MKSSILGSVLCLTLFACVASETPDPEDQAPEEVSTSEQAIGDSVNWICLNAPPGECVIMPGWFPRIECVRACQALGITTPKCVLRVDPECNM